MNKSGNITYHLQAKTHDSDEWVTTGDLKLLYTNSNNPAARTNILCFKVTNYDIPTFNSENLAASSIKGIFKLQNEQEIPYTKRDYYINVKGCKKLRTARVCELMQLLEGTIVHPYPIYRIKATRS